MDKNTSRAGKQTKTRRRSLRILVDRYRLVCFFVVHTCQYHWLTVQENDIRKRAPYLALYLCRGRIKLSG